MYSDNIFYFTSEEFFLYINELFITFPSKMNYTCINRYIVFFTVTLLRRFSAFCYIPISDWFDDVIKSAAPYVTMKYSKTKHDRDLHK